MTIYMDYLQVSWGEFRRKADRTPELTRLSSHFCPKRRASISVWILAYGS